MRKVASKAEEGVEDEADVEATSEAAEVTIKTR